MNKFELGTIVATPAALAAIRETAVLPSSLLDRHASGDWGDVSVEDAAENEYSVTRELRILSSYALPDKTEVWILTEGDRSATTILLPEEY